MKEFAEIQTALESIRKVIELEPCTVDDMEGKLTKISALAGLAAECQASSIALYRSKLGDAIRILSKEDYSASHTKLIAEGDCSKFCELQVYAERISAGVSHNISGLITQISKYKTELANSMYQK